MRKMAQCLVPSLLVMALVLCGCGQSEGPSRISARLSAAGTAAEVVDISISAGGYPYWPLEEVKITDRARIQEIYDLVLASKPDIPKEGYTAATDQANWVAFRFKRGKEAIFPFGVGKSTQYMYGKDFVNYFNTHRP